jgi:hypothetical protein
MRHGEDRNICPYCMKRFDDRQGVKAHMKSKRHRQRIERTLPAPAASMTHINTGREG